MKDTSELKEKGKQTLENFKAMLDELKVQVALGKKEAKDAFAKERKTLYNYVSKEKALLRKSAERSSEHEQDLMDKLVALGNELDKTVPPTKREFDAYKKELLQSIYNLEYAIKTESHDVRKSLQKKLEGFKVKLDGYRLQVAMSDYNHRDNIETRKAELEERINDIRTMVADRQAGERKWEHFSEEVSASYQNMKQAFSDLLA